MPRDLATLRVFRRSVRSLRWGRLEVRDMVLFQFCAVLAGLGFGLRVLGIETGWWVGAISSLCALTSLLLHEGAHLLLARFFRVGINRVEVRGLLNAGVRRARARSRRHELAIVSAGPVVTLLLIFLGVWLVLNVNDSLLRAVGWSAIASNGLMLGGCLPGPEVTDGSKLVRLVQGKSW